MSDEQRKDEETEVEGHRMKRAANDEPSAEGESEGEDDFEAHRLRKDYIKKD